MNKCDRCPLQWINGDRSCFLIIIAPKRNFNNSLNHCQTFYNASLFESSHKINYISPHLQNNSYYEFWVRHIWMLYYFFNLVLHKLNSGSRICQKYRSMC